MSSICLASSWIEYIGCNKPLMSKTEKNGFKFTYGNVCSLKYIPSSALYCQENIWHHVTSFSGVKVSGMGTTVSVQSRINTFKNSTLSFLPYSLLNLKTVQVLFFYETLPHYLGFLWLPPKMGFSSEPS